MNAASTIVPIRRRLCAFHRATPESRFLKTSCAPSVCEYVTADVEMRGRLNALQSISGDLIDALEKGTQPMLGSMLATALTIQDLVTSLDSYLESPLGVAREPRGQEQA